VDWQQQCAAIIPCLNEAKAIARLVASVRGHLPVVIVVDDGSWDQTGAEARAVGADVLRLPRNQGKGAALRAGLHYAQAQGFAWGLTLDGDGQHLAEDMPAFFTCAETTGADLVIGNRLGTPDAMPWLRRSVNRWMTARLSFLCGRSLADSQCGFRLIRIGTWAALPLRTEHFEVESEFLVEFVRAGHRVEFVPVQTLYPARGSKIHPVVDSWRWFRWWWAQRLAIRPGRSEVTGPRVERSG
jgi:glycosyltransferase involved in cell wall biosynthesis